MRAFRVVDFTLQPLLLEIEVPSPAAGEVLLSIEACGLNFADILMSRGTYQDTPEPPFTLGLEVCGRVEQLGEGVSYPPVGARVVLFGGSGGLAEKGCFPADRCIVIPEDMPCEVAAGFLVAYGSSHLALTRRARLQAGETLLVTGAAGGVGLTAVEVGKQLGARVIAVARGQEKLEIARKAGADLLFDAGDDQLIGRVKDLGGIDVAYDPVGGESFKLALKTAKREARLLAIGFASGDVPKVPANHLLVKNVDVIGFYWGGYLKFNPQALVNSLQELLDWYQQGRLRPHVSNVLTLEEAGQGLDLLASRVSTGKVVIRI